MQSASEKSSVSPCLCVQEKESASENHAVSVILNNVKDL